MNAFLYLAANPFPGFTGAPGRYPLDLELPAEPQRQNRWKTAFRCILFIPAALVSFALGWALAGRRGLHLVLRARDREGALGPAEPLGLRAAILRAAERLRLSPDRPVPAREPARGRGRAAADEASEPPSLNGPEPLRRDAAPRGRARGRRRLGPRRRGCSGARRSPRTGLPHLDPHGLFPAGELRRATHFSEAERLFWLANTVTQLVVLGLFARYGVRFTRESAAGPIGTGMLLGMLGFALVWARAGAVRGARGVVAAPLRDERQLRRRPRSGTGSRSASGSSSSAPRSGS